MAITIQLPNGKCLRFESTTILVGSDSSCDIQITDAELEPQHARLRKVANRWMVESQGDWPIQAGESGPGRSCWFAEGDVIRLSPAGPDLVVGTPSDEPEGTPKIAASSPPPMTGAESPREHVASAPPPMPAAPVQPTPEESSPPPMPQGSSSSQSEPGSPPPMPPGSLPPPMPGAQ